MKKLTVVLYLSGLIISTAVYAADRPYYFGVSAGQTRILHGVDGSYAVASTATVTAGYVFAKTDSFKGIFEGNYTRTVKNAAATINNVADEYKEETFGAFVAARTKSDFYFKGKVGLVRHRIITNTQTTYDDYKASAGFGIGIKDNAGGITELEYVLYNGDISLVNISYLF